MAEITTPPGARDRWAERKTARPTKPPITVDRILATSFALIEADGFEALTMRRVAAALQTGPASLYAHVRNKADLDDLLIGELCALVTLPTPDAADWRAQFVDVCRQLRDQYGRYPGISRAVLTAAPQSLDTLRISEGMLAILLAGGIAVQNAAWAIDAALLYVAAYALEASLSHHADGRAAVLADRLALLPPDRFPLTIANAAALTSGQGHARFDFSLDLLLAGLDRRA